MAEKSANFYTDVSSDYQLLQHPIYQSSEAMPIEQ